MITLSIDVIRMIISKLKRKEAIRVLFALYGTDSRFIHELIPSNIRLTYRDFLREGCVDLIPELHRTGIDHADIDYVLKYPSRQEDALFAIRFYNEQPNVRCTESAMDYAAEHGYLNIVAFLHFNRKEGCTRMAMTRAAEYGHLEIVRFLYINRTERCASWTIDKAAKNGHLEIVKFLHFKLRECCSYRGLAEACQYGNMEIVKFLYSHYDWDEKSIRMAVKSAVRSGNLDILKFFRDNDVLPYPWIYTEIAEHHEQSTILKYLLTF